MSRICVILFSLLLFSFSLASAMEGSAGNERFQVIDNAVVVDSQTGLMWAAQDNGRDISWYDAEKYCEEFEAGGYADWRLPDLKELATLYTKDRKNRDGYFIVDVIKVTDCCVWSSETNMGGASSFSYTSGRKPFGYMRDTYQLRALPVRGAEKMEAHE